jgi:hypothetical protein
MNKIIAFYGPQQSGKSTAADAVAMWQGWRKASFAQPLYDMMSALLRADARTISKEEPLESLSGRTLRYALQTLGTSWGRECMDENIWLEQMGWKMLGVDTVIDDMRFFNEYEFLKENGATIVKIDRPEEEAPEDGHASEQDWESFKPDFVLTNNFVTAKAWQGHVRAELKHLL